MAARVFWVLICIVFVGKLRAQDNPVTQHRLQIKFGGNVPHPVSNKAFRMTFIGVYDLNLTLRAKMFAGFSAGIHGMHSFWKIPDNKIPGLHTVGQFNGGGISLSYDHPTGEVGVVYATINAGRSMTHYYGLSYDSIPDNFQTKYFVNYGQLELGAYFYTEGNFAIGIQTSFMYTSFDFDPFKLSLNEHKAYHAEDLEGSVMTFNLGFSVVYSFLEKKGI